ncbi:MAG: hypothetical protein HYV02_01040 [Deltaproteobacteria bacterium]|nr:hypothetical protein [Deltaproteobacteria bacterium]
MTQTTVIRTATAALVKRHGVRARADILSGVTACARVWDFRKEGPQRFAEFALQHYLPPGRAKRQLLHRLDRIWRLITGSMTVIRKETRAGLDIADLPLTPAEGLLGAFSVSSHLEEDYRQGKIAALVQLNFGTERLDPPKTRAGWAARRLAAWGREVIPAKLKVRATAIHAQVDQFVSSYNLYVDQIDFGDPDIRFPKGTRLISHWGLRDYMMQLYGAPHGLKKQRALLELLRRVVDGEIPAEILDQPLVGWSVPDGTIHVRGKTRKARGHGALRWQHFRSLFHAARAIDPHTRFGNMIDQKFLEEREIPEARVRKMLTEVLGAAVAPRVGQYLAQRFERPLEPFDIYFKNFLGDAKKSPLKVALNRQYRTSADLQRAIPKIMRQLGFDAKTADSVAPRIRVDNGRSAGHAWSPGTAHDLQLLRVRVPKDGISEIEFSTFMHELGHCVEGVLSSYRMDYQSLWGVPNSAITEAFAFTFQDRAEDILGRARRSDPHVVMLQRFWEVFEIAGPALVEIDFFHWLYQHPQATAAQMQHALREINDRMWARYHRPIFGPESYGLLAAYSHMLWCDLYLADYPIGYLCAYQIRRFLKGKVLGKEMPRICSVGAVYPDAWMEHAVGAPISVEPLLRDTAMALRALKCE